MGAAGIAGCPAAAGAAAKVVTGAGSMGETEVGSIGVMGAGSIGVTGAGSSGVSGAASTVAAGSAVGGTSKAFSDSSVIDSPSLLVANRTVELAEGYAAGDQLPKIFASS